MRVRAFKAMFSHVPLVQWAAAALFVVTFGKQSLHILTQYASKHFDISVAHAGYLLSIKAIVNLVLYALLPSARRLQGASAVVSNARLARVSVVLLALGVALMGLSPTLWLLLPST